MKLFKVIYLKPMLTLLLTFLAFSAKGQSYLQATGNPSFSTNIPVPNGYIDLANGNLHLEIPLATHKQRGALKLNERLIYDSRIWEIVEFNNYYWWPINVPNSSSGWRFVMGNEATTVAGAGGTGSSASCTGLKGSPTYQKGQSYYSWTDPTGTVRTFDAGWSYNNELQNCFDNDPSTTPVTVSGYATDASGYLMTLSGTKNAGGPNSITVRDPSGTQVYPQVIDRFGNYWTSDSSGNLVDDLGRTPVIQSQNGNSLYYDVLAPNGPISNGTRIRYTVTFENLTLTTNFAQPGVTEYQNNGNPPGSNHPQISAVQSIQLPDGSSYQFSYDQYGEIQSVTLPTGGMVSYGWSNYTDAYQNVNRWLTSSTINGYTTTYTPSVLSQCSSGGTGCQEQVDVARPSGDETVYKMTLDNGAWNVNSTIYQGPASNNVPLVEDTTTYNFSNTCSNSVVCNGAAFITKATENDQYPPGNVQSQTVTSYANPINGQLTSLSSWDYFPIGSSPISIPSRSISYGHTGFDLTSEIHYDANGNQASGTLYNYTSAASVTSGIVNHGASNSGGPFLTSVTEYISGSSGGSGTQTKTVGFSYDDTGSLTSTTDFKQNSPTQYHYDPTDTFVTEIDKPDTTTVGQTYHHITKASYDPNSGLILSTDDENSVALGGFFTTQYTYEASAGRLFTVTNSNLLSRTYTYPSPNEVDETTVQTTTPSPVNLIVEKIADAYGRPSQIISNGVSTETTYDGNGRVSTTTNPHLQSGTSQTDGTTSFSYDSLDRAISQKQPDGRSLTTQYQANVTTATDELGNQTRYTYDAFSNLDQVTEPDPTSGTLSLTTVYFRDGLGNVVCVEQHGNVSGSGCGTSTPSVPVTSDLTSPWRVRRFYYDELGELLAAEIPEHWSAPNSPPSQNCNAPGSGWTDCYAYDPNGNLASSNSNDGIVRSFSYDSLDRVLAETSGNISKSYSYDEGLNGYGRVYRQTDNLSSSSTKYGYDGLGRVQSERACRASGYCASTTTAYDMVGNVVLVGYPDGRVVANSIDSKNHLSAVTYSQWGTQNVGTTYWSNPSYLPPGMISQSQLGTAVIAQAMYNNRQNVTEMSYQSPQGTLLDNQYIWDGNAKNLLSVYNTQNTQSRQLTYDKLNRLLTAVDSQGATQASANVTVTGSDGTHTVCITIREFENGHWFNDTECNDVSDTGFLNLTVNSFTAHVTCDGSTTDPALAQSLANALNVSGSPVTASAPASPGNVVYMTSIARGSAANYPLTVTSKSDFQGSPSGTQLTGGLDGVAVNNGVNQQYGWDSWGNLYGMGSSGFNQSVNNQNQISTFGYDPSGRLQNDGVLSYTYDANGMLATSSDGEAYQYDGDNQRASISGGSSSEEYYYISGRLIALRSPTSGEWTDIIYAGSRKIAEVGGTQTALPEFVISDQIGSVVAAVDSNGNLLSNMSYAPFGNLLSGGSPDNFIFAGLQRDSTNLDHATLRQYASNSGRWLTPDPYDGSYLLSNPQTFNRFTYTGNPLYYVDPSGLCSNGNDNVGGGTMYDGDHNLIGPYAGGPCGFWGDIGNFFKHFFEGKPHYNYNLADLRAGKIILSNNKIPWYKNNCVRDAAKEGGRNLAVDSIAFIPEAGGVARVIGHQAGYVGVVADKYGSKLVTAIGKTAEVENTAIGFGLDDATSWVSTAITIADFIPVVNEFSAAASVAWDAGVAGYKVYECLK